MKKVYLILAAVIVISGCFSQSTVTKKIVSANSNENAAQQIVIADGFDFKMTKNVMVELENASFTNMDVSIYDKTDALNPVVLEGGTFDSEGKYSTSVVVVKGTEAITVKVDLMEKELVVPIINGKAEMKILQNKRAVKIVNSGKKSFSKSIIDGTLVFEDKWPVKGDYDVNDVVISCKNASASGKNDGGVEYVETYKCQYQVVASGAEYNSGFALHLGVNPAFIDSISGTSEGDIASHDVGLELDANGNKTSNIIIFNNVKERFVKTAVNYNTIVGAFINSKPLTLEVKFKSGTKLSDLGDLSNIDHFIYRTNDRGLEVHLMNNAPTVFADKKYFGTADDNSNISTGKYYVSRNGMPWAMNIPVKEFAYPIERKDITTAYLKFADWAQNINGGRVTYAAWYKNISGNVNINNLYIK